MKYYIRLPRYLCRVRSSLVLESFYASCAIHFASLVSLVLCTVPATVFLTCKYVTFPYRSEITALMTSIYGFTMIEMCTSTVYVFVSTSRFTTGASFTRTSAEYVWTPSEMFYINRDLSLQPRLVAQLEGYLVVVSSLSLDWKDHRDSDRCSWTWG